MDRKFKITVLVATMFNDNIENLIKEMKLTTDSIVVNQCDCNSENVYTITVNGKKVTVIDTNERGLSRSRNKALSFVDKDCDVVIFTDDDIEFEDNYAEIVEQAYKDKKKDAVIFNVRRANGSLNKKLGKKINQISLFRVCSVSMTARMDKIRGIQFDTCFGAGSGKFTLGEENIFVSDCLKKGLSIYSDDRIMCQICDKRPSTWYEGFNRKMMTAKGASFKRMHRYMYILLILDFGLRKYRWYKHNMSLTEAFKALLEGSKEYARLGKCNHTNLQNK